LVQVLLARFGAGDAAGIARLFARRVEWRAPDPTSTLWTSGIRTRREVESFFLSTFSLQTLEALTVRRLLIDGEDAAVLGQTRWRTSESTLDSDFAMSLSVHQGEVDEYWLLQDTLAMALSLNVVRWR
jgi:ketosteroid isomerase-like protein